MRKSGVFFSAVLAGVFLLTPVFAGQDEKDDNNKFTVKGEIRIRGEFLENYSDFNDDLGDGTDLFPARFRVAVKGDLGKNVFVFGEIQAIDVFGEDRPNTGGGFDRPFQGDDNDAGFYQAWVALKEIGGTNFSLKMGRQEITLGRELLWGNLDYYNGTNHDAVSAYWDYDNFKIRTWWTREDELCDTNSGSCISGRDRDENFYVGAVTWDYDNNSNLDLYAINNRDDQKSGNFRIANVWTVGARYNHWEEGDGVFNYSVEFATQSGDTGVGGVEFDKSASVLEGEVSYMWGTGRSHMVHIGYTLASGDEDDTDTDDDEFDPLFQDFHYRLGLADLFDTRNISAIEVGYAMKVSDSHKWGVDVYEFTAAEDGVNSATPGVDDLGNELDVWYKFKYSENVTFNASLALYMPGDIAIAQGAFDPATRWSAFGVGVPDDDITRLSGQIRARW